MRTIKLLLLLIILIGIPNQLSAQQTTIPLCDKIEVVNAELEKKLNLFTEYDGFQQALLYKENENLYILEIIYKPKDIFKVERKSMTKADLDAFCTKINTSETLDKIMELDQSGRTEFLISSTVSGLSFYAWGLPRALGIESDRGTIASYMLIGGSGFFVPFLATRNKEVTTAMARSYSVGTVTGVGHGLLVRQLLELDNDFPNYDYRKGERRLLVPIAMGIGEGLGLMALTHKYDLSVGNVSMMATGGVWGAGWGAGIGTIMTGENDDFKTESRKGLFSTLIGSGAGMYLGHKVYQKTPNLTNGDVLVVNAYGVLGALTAATISDLAMDFNEYNHSKILLGSMTATSIGGMAYGLYRTKNYNYTNGEGAYIGLSEISGGLLGLGIGYLINDDFSSETALVSSTIGATAGLLIVDNYLRKRSLKVNTSIGNFDFGFNPMGIANAFEEDNTVRNLEYYQRSTNNYIVRAAMTF